MAACAHADVLQVCMLAAMFTSLIMLSFPVLKERDARGRFICAQCPDSSSTLKGG